MKGWRASLFSSHGPPPKKAFLLGCCQGIELKFPEHGCTVNTLVSDLWYLNLGSLTDSNPATGISKSLVWLLLSIWGPFCGCPSKNNPTVWGRSRATDFWKLPSRDNEDAACDCKSCSRREEEYARCPVGAEVSTEHAGSTWDLLLMRVLF